MSWKLCWNFQWKNKLPNCRTRGPPNRWMYFNIGLIVRGWRQIQAEMHCTPYFTISFAVKFVAFSWMEQICGFIKSYVLIIPCQCFILGYNVCFLAYWYLIDWCFFFLWILMKCSFYVEIWITYFDRTPVSAAQPEYSADMPGELESESYFTCLKWHTSLHITF